MYTPWSGACVLVHYIGCRVREWGLNRYAYRVWQLRV